MKRLLLVKTYAIQKPAESNLHSVLFVLDLSAQKPQNNNYKTSPKVFDNIFSTYPFI